MDLWNSFVIESKEQRVHCAISYFNFKFSARVTREKGTISVRAIVVQIMKSLDYVTTKCG